jgi:hypothetical protein
MHARPTIPLVRDLNDVLRHPDGRRESTIFEGWGIRLPFSGS